MERMKKEFNSYEDNFVTKGAMDYFIRKNIKKYGDTFLDGPFLVFCKQHLDRLSHAFTRAQLGYNCNQKDFDEKKLFNRYTFNRFFGGKEFVNCFDKIALVYEIDEVWVNWDKFEKDPSNKKFFKPDFDFTTYFKKLDSDYGLE